MPTKGIQPVVDSCGALVRARDMVRKPEYERQGFCSNCLWDRDKPGQRNNGCFVCCTIPRAEQLSAPPADAKKRGNGGGSVKKSPPPTRQRKFP